MRVLVTRPCEDAGETAAKLAARGHEAILAPLLEIKFREGDEISLDGMQAVLVTSANGIRAFAARTKMRDVKILAVGAQSAEEARLLGFHNVEHADGDAAALAKLATAKLKPARGALFHAAGREMRGNLAETLEASGFSVRSEVLYEAIAAKTLPPEAQAALTENAVDAILFFSPRTARIFAQLTAEAGLAPACRNVRAVCISPPAADALRPLVFREVKVAPRPNQDALLALLGA